MERTEILWQEGTFICELRTTPNPPYLCVSQYDEEILAIAIATVVEARERASALRLVVRNNLALNRWIPV